MIREVFSQAGTFEAARAAEAWCKERGISYGPSDRYAMRGLLYGDFLIAKWHNLNKSEIAALDGRMTGDMRNGPVVIEIKERP